MTKDWIENKQFNLFFLAPNTIVIKGILFHTQIEILNTNRTIIIALLMGNAQCNSKKEKDKFEIRAK